MSWSVEYALWSFGVPLELRRIFRYYSAWLSLHAVQPGKNLLIEVVVDLTVVDDVVPVTPQRMKGGSHKVVHESPLARFSGLLEW